MENTLGFPASTCLSNSASRSACPPTSTTEIRFGVLRCLTNALARTGHRPTVRDLQAIYRDVAKVAVTIRRVLAIQTRYDTRTFHDLVIAASMSARKRIPSLRHLPGA